MLPRLITRFFARLCGAWVKESQHRSIALQRFSRLRLRVVCRAFSFDLALRSHGSLDELPRTLYLLSVEEELGVLGPGLTRGLERDLVVPVA